MLQAMSCETLLMAPADAANFLRPGVNMLALPVPQAAAPEAASQTAFFAATEAVLAALPAARGPGARPRRQARRAARRAATCWRISARPRWCPGTSPRSCRPGRRGSRKARESRGSRARGPGGARVAPAKHPFRRSTRSSAALPAPAFWGLPNSAPGARGTWHWLKIFSFSTSGPGVQRKSRWPCGLGQATPALAKKSRENAHFKGAPAITPSASALAASASPPVIAENGRNFSCRIPASRLPGSGCPEKRKISDCSRHNPMCGASWSKLPHSLGFPLPSLHSSFFLRNPLRPGPISRGHRAGAGWPWPLQTSADFSACPPRG